MAALFCAQNIEEEIAMARSVVDNDQWFAIPITGGTLQNTGPVPVEISNAETDNTGLVLQPNEIYQWSDATIYARKAWGGVASGEITYVPFKKAAGGGGGSSYILPMAELNVLGGVKSSNTVGKVSVGSDGTMTYNAPDAQPLEAPEWEENTAYAVNALVEHNDDVYMCLVAHTSTSDFDADLAGGKWKLVGLALDVATTSVLGGVKADDSDGGVSVAADGKMSINLPTASTTVKGGVKVGTGLAMDGQKLGVSVATSSVVAGVKSSTTDGKVKVESDGTMTMNLPTATTTVKGGIKIGTGVEVDANQKLNVTAATASVIGGVKSSTDDGKVAVNSDGTMKMNLPIATTTVLGGVKSSTSDFDVSVDDSGNMLLNLPAIDFWKPNTEYAGLGTVRWAKNLRRAKKLAIVQGGTSGSTLSIGSISQADGALIEDGTAVWIVDSFASMHNSAGTRNSMYRGVDLTAYMDSGLMSANIANGTFTGIYPGDYVRKTVTIDGTTYADVKWVVMDLDYFLNLDDYRVTTHHVVLMPEEALGTAPMNVTNTTAGGFLGSDMWTTTIPLVNTGIESAFGATHVLTHREILTNAVETTAKASGYSGWNGAASGNEWTTVKANLASEGAVFGTMEVSSSWRDGGTDSSQFAAFRYNHSLICSKRYTWWLRAVANTTDFCTGGMHGRASFNHASENGSLRPYFLYY